MVKSSLASFGIAIKSGVVNIGKLAVDNLNTKTARMQEIEMVATNGDVYCTWIDATGNWQKVKGNCADVGPTVQSVTTTASVATPVQPTTPTVPTTPTTPTPVTPETPTTPRIS